MVKEPKIYLLHSIDLIYINLCGRMIFVVAHESQLNPCWITHLVRYPDSYSLIVFKEFNQVIMTV